MQRVSTVALLLVSLAAEVASHGVLLQPRSRNWLAYVKESYYNSHGLNAGGVDVVSKKRKLTYPQGRHGYCGDAYNQQRWDVPGSTQASYVQGQEITVDFVIATNHLGRIDMTVCDLDAKPEDNKCQSLQRADGKGQYWYLPFLSNWTGGNAGFVQPAYSDGSFSWYRMPEVRYAEGCRKQRLCNQFIGMIVYRTQWKLPADYSCRQCKLQWHYLTASSCWPMCHKGNQGEPTCKNIQVFPECGTPGSGYPEVRNNSVSVAYISTRAHGHGKSWL
eukprot:GHUV01032205.1.p1 GENE.GHUV01032205.1~~GHUV01032205.1.p1  ORF type:complete len:275 (+),score=48.24 GHUV01032205.1:164-988(+)